MKGIPLQEFCDRAGLYAAKDSDGSWFIYSDAPIKKLGAWFSKGDASRIVQGIIVPDVDWEYSLISPTPSIKDLVIDQPIMVYGAGNQLTEWKKRYFAGISSKGKVQAWSEGGTSWSSNDKIEWNEWRLPTEEELKGGG